MSATKTILLGGAAALASLTLVSGTTWSQEIGKASAVNPASTGTPPQRPTRVLELGASVIHKERIRTTDNGNVQLLFVDKTTLNIGPNSDLVIDEFIYDPNTGTGRMAATMTKGLLRFVGGNTSHTGGATIKTPSATLGIRGGVATVQHGAGACDGVGAGTAPAAAGAACTRAISHFGTLSATTAAGVEVIRRPGFGITIPTPSAPPPAPTRVSQAEIDAANRQLTSGPRQSGGAKQKPNEQVAARAGIGSANRNIRPDLVEGQRQTVVSRTTNTTTVVSPAREIVREGASQTAAQETVREDYHSPSTPSTPPPTTPVRGRTFALTTAPDPALNSGVPYVLGTVAATGGVTVSPVLGYRVEGTTDRPSPPARTMQTAIGINGSGASQSSVFMVSTGSFEFDSIGTGVYSARFAATGRRTAAENIGTAQGSVASVPGTVSLDDDRIPTSFSANQNRFTGDAISAASAVARPGGGSPQTYGFNQTYAATTPPSGLGSPRPDAALLGFSGGLVSTTNLSTNARIEQSQPLYGSTYLIVDPNDSRAQLNQFFVADRMSSTPTDGFEEGYFQFGSIDPNQPAQSAYIDYENFAANESILPPDQDAIVNTVNGAPVQSRALAMASSGGLPVRSLFPGVNFCQCAYTRWGFWSADVQRSGSGGVTFADRVHLGTWVTGQLPDPSEIPTSGRATYTGHVIANIRNGSNEYLAAGNLTNEVNFGTATASATVIGLDGRSYGGALVLPAGSPYLVGTLNTTAGPTATMDMIGSFYRGPSSPVQEMGGNVIINGTNYVGSGTFAAQTSGITP